MNNKFLILLIFIIIALVQLYVPAKMILNRENILETGKEYKFKSAPLDPNDPFRGKYMTLRFEENTFIIQDEKKLTRGEQIYVRLTIDTDGYAKVMTVSKELPTGKVDYVKAKIGYMITNNNTKKIIINYPFNRYYLKETKAQKAESIYRESLSDTSRIVCALVSIKDGDAVLKDVLIDGIPIDEITEVEKKVE